MAETAALETAKDAGEPPRGTVGLWLNEIRAYDKTFKNWSERAVAINKRYRNESDTDGSVSENVTRFQILWSNVQTILPALYSRIPEPDITRTFKDRDQIARASAEILERATRTETRDNGLDGAMKAAVLDYLLTARGQAWVRYVPTYGKETRDRVELQSVANEADGSVSYAMPDGKPLPDGEKPQFDNGQAYAETGDPYRPVVSECVEFDSIAWRDFGHTPAPKWSKVRAVWRIELMTRDQLVERFGKEKGEAVSLTKAALNVDEQAVKAFGDAFKRGEVYEIWDRPSNKVIWISPGYKDGPLDEKPDPLGLEDFFPCPEPLYGTRTTDTLVPIADYDEYRTQAEEIDKLTARIQGLTKALRYNGAYNGAVGDILEDILTSNDGKMIAVEEWTLLGDRGLQGNMSFVSVKEVADVIVALTGVRQQLKQDLSEITGISDIVRGQSSGGTKTATEQRIKGQFAGMRIQDRQSMVVRFARDLVKIGAEVIAEHFSAETLWDISGWQHSDEARALDFAVTEWEQKQAAAQQVQMAAMQQQQNPQPNPPGAVQQPGAAGPSPPPPPAAPTGERPPSSKDVFMRAVQMLRDERMRSYRIDIETDQMVLDDREKDRGDRIQLVTAVGGFLQQALPAIQMYPQSAGVLVQLLQFALRGWNTGRTLEAAFEEAGDQLLQSKANPQQQASPQAAGDQAKLAVDQQKLQLTQQKQQTDAALQGQKQQTDATLGAAELQLKNRQLALDEQALARDAGLQTAKIQSDQMMHGQSLAADERTQLRQLMMEMQRLQAEVQQDRAQIAAMMAGRAAQTQPQAPAVAG